jgi:hypothetical protein
VSIVRDDCAERLMRADRMIDAFRKSQLRRLANPNTLKRADCVVESLRDAHRQVAVAGPTPPTPASSRE